MKNIDDSIHVNGKNTKLVYLVSQGKRVCVRDALCSIAALTQFIMKCEFPTLSKMIFRCSRRRRLQTSSTLVGYGKHHLPAIKMKEMKHFNYQVFTHRLDIYEGQLQFILKGLNNLKLIQISNVSPKNKFLFLRISSFMN